GSCPEGKVRDWAGICFNKNEAKACLTCAPGSAAPAEEPKTAQVEANKEAEKPQASAQVRATTELTINVSPDIVNTGLEGTSVRHVTGKLAYISTAPQPGLAHPPGKGEVPIEHLTGLRGATITFETILHGGYRESIRLSPTQTESDGSYNVTGSIE